MLVLSQIVSALGSVLAWSLRKPVTLADSLHSQTSAPFHKWAKVEDVDDEGMVGNEFLAAEELVRNALFGNSSSSTLSVVKILRSQDFDPDETEEMLEACRKGDVWALRRTIDWVADYIQDEVEEAR